MGLNRTIWTVLTAWLLALPGPTKGADRVVRFVSSPGSHVLIDGGNNVHEWQIKGESIEGTAEFGPGFPIATNDRVRMGDVRGQSEGSIPVRSLHEAQ